MKRNDVTAQDVSDFDRDVDDAVFIVRVRRSESPSATSVHGRVEHLPSRTTCYFKNCDSLCQFLMENLYAEREKDH